MTEGRTAFPFELWRRLTRDEHASTFIRLAESRHVADLQLIFWSSLILMFAGSIFVAVWHRWVDSGGVIGSGALISAIVGTGCGVLVWTYQTGSARLGIVDLFSCEITTICRVITIAETASRYVSVYEDPPAIAVNFRSEEQYTPIFDNNSKDLEMLEARVVERITELYTYLKAMRDNLRLVGLIENPQAELERWRFAIRSTIYMLFLMLESGRESVDRLIEYEPEQLQNTITILLSELVAYGLLLKEFETEAETRPAYNARLERLRLRRDYYRDLVPTIYWRVQSFGDAKEWQNSLALIGELNQRYHDVFDKWIDAKGSRATDSNICKLDIAKSPH